MANVARGSLSCATSVLHREAQVRVLSHLASGEDDAFELLGAVAPFDVRGHFTPNVALLEVAATAQGIACPPGSEPLEFEGLTDRYLPDQMLTGRTLRQRTQDAIYAAACLRGGLLPDLLREAGGWKPRLWTYTVSAVITPAPPPTVSGSPARARARRPLAADRLTAEPTPPNVRPCNRTNRRRYLVCHPTHE